jgi:sialate O-acetylesterase
MKRLAHLTALTLLLAASARADVKLPAIFGDHMVVQAGMKLPVWGTADAGERVTVKAAGQAQSATAGADGKWRVVLDPLEATAPIGITIAGNNSITLKDVLVGEVWLCSGQSNMGFALKNVKDGAAAIQKAENPKIRLFTVGRDAVAKPGAEMNGSWKVCSPESAGDFSAVAYFFGLDLHQKLAKPVGLIDASWGGTRAEAWVPRPAFDALNLSYEPAWTEQWLNPPAEAAAKNPRQRKRPEQAPAALYDGMIAPIAGYAMRGAVWYQGETNTAYPKEYRDVLAALIKGWRGAWEQGDFPVLVVQLPNFVGRGRDWPTLRAGQAQVARDLPNVGVVATIDVGESNDIHPRDKLTVGKRLAAAAEKIAYGRDVPFSGPVFKSMSVDGDETVVRFDYAFGGLVARGGELKGFEIAGDLGKFVPAIARIDGETVRVRADGVASPKFVRYGWANDPTCTLYNKADLPALPFQAQTEGE